jgi:peptidoglycan/LPS O-acetylase OafA/YrhL
LSPPGSVFDDGSYTWQFILTAATVIAILSDLNYRLIEVPLRRKGAAIAKRLRDEPAQREVAE